MIGQTRQLTIAATILLGLKNARGPLILCLLLMPLVLLPIAWLIIDGISAGGESAWRDVFFGPLSKPLFWLPFSRSLLVAIAAASIATLLGCLLAILIETTDLAGRQWLRPLIALPFLAPSFALAMAWIALFDNDRIGGSSGLLSAMGINTVDSIAWGSLPITVVIGLHYFPLTYFLIAAALARLPNACVESAVLAGAKPWTILKAIVLPSLRPVFASSAVICFAEAISNFSVPAILGTPVRFFTLSTQLYRLIENGQAFRGAMLMLLLTVFSLICLTVVYRHWNQHHELLTINVKRRVQIFQLGCWRWPVSLLTIVSVLLIALVPVLALLVSSLSHEGNILSENWTLHYWLGNSDLSIAQGQEGILKLPIVYEGLWVTLAFGLTASLLSTLFALYIARWCRNHQHGLLPSLINTVCVLPAMIPSIGLGGAFLILYGGPIGPLPALYGSLTLLIMVGIAATLPYAMQSAYSALAYIPRTMEEAAHLTGANGLQSAITIVLPLSIRSLSASVALNFSRLIRNLDLVILIFTPATPLLAILAYRFSIDGFPQFAHALALIIMLMAILTRLLAERMQDHYVKHYERQTL